jgi:hypothetical protein
MNDRHSGKIAESLDSLEKSLAVVPVHFFQLYAAPGFTVDHIHGNGKNVEFIEDFSQTQSNLRIAHGIGPGKNQCEHLVL